MEIVGKVIQVLPLQQGTSTRSGNPWTLKTFILETQENYPRRVAIEIFGDQRIADNPAEVDQIVTVSFDLESREFNGRWYTSVRAWKILQGVQTQAAPVQPVTPAAPAAPAAPVSEAPEAPVTNTFDAVAAQGDDTDLPF